MSQQNSATPWDFIRALEHKFNVRVTFDLACTIEDKKAPDGYYFDQGVDALKQDWSQIPVPKQSDGKESVGFLNPPWKSIRPWAKLCAEGTGRLVLDEVEVADELSCTIEGIRIFSLFPAGVGSQWFSQYVAGQCDIYFLHPRITYLDPRTNLPFYQKYPKTHAKAGQVKLNAKGDPMAQTGLNDCILCDWPGSGDYFCWDWSKTLAKINATR